MDPYFSPAPDKLIERALKAEQQRDELLQLLKWLNARGGLGLDIHARIITAIAKIEGEE